MKCATLFIASCLLLVATIQAFNAPLTKSNRLLQKQCVAAPVRGPTTLFAKDELNEVEAAPVPSTEPAGGDDIDIEALEKLAGAGGKKKKKKTKASVKLEPEVTIFEGAPSPTEVILPAVSVLTVIGIIPFAAAVSRQLWVKYKITSRRISVTSGIGGKDLTEIIYPEIRDMKFIYRAFGAAGDVAITLNDGSKLEIRSLPNFEELYQYIYDKLSPEAQEDSDKLTKKN
mmetsp:Transcript_14575/g.19172  ORF Transcript_14575/g.19172 Transcript_14575/m.19172 type:complete len:229 (+) Transcript_14575:102-788(+)